MATYKPANAIGNIRSTGRQKPTEPPVRNVLKPTRASAVGGTGNPLQKIAQKRLYKRMGGG